MLERATTCPKHGLKHVQSLSAKLPRSRRLLHSAFWDHGAGDINLPSWWLEFLCKPPCDTPSLVQRITNTAKRYVPIALKSSFLIDFLYPPKALSLAHQIIAEDSRSSKRWQKQNAISQLRRRFASNAVEASAEPEKINMHQGEAPAQTLFGQNATAEGFQEGASELQEQETHQGLRGAEKEFVGVDEGPLEPAGPAEHIEAIPASQNARVTIEALVQQKGYNGRLWTKLQAIPEFNNNVMSLEDDAKDILQIELETLQRVISKLSKDYNHFLETLLPTDRGMWTSKDFVRAIKASYLTSRSLDPEAVETEELRLKVESRRRRETLAVFQSALDNDQEVIAAPTLFDLAFSFNDWDLGYYGLARLQKKLGKHHARSHLSTVLSQYDIEVLGNKIMELAQLYGRQRRQNPDVTSETVEEHIVMTLVVPVIEYFFERQITVDYHPLMLRNVWYALKEAEVPSHAMYRSSIEQMLSPLGDPNEISLATKLAYERWQSTSGIKGFRHDHETIKELCRRLQKTHHPGAGKVFNRLRQDFGPPSVELYHGHLQELSHRGDLEGFDRELSELRKEHGVDDLQPFLVQLIAAYGRRADTAGAKDLFSSIESKYSLRPGVDCWNAMIGVLVRTNSLREALDWVLIMQEQDIQPNVETFELVIRAFCDRGEVDAAEGFLRDLREGGIPIEARVVDHIIYAHARNGNIDEAEKILFDTLRDNVPGNKTRMWNTVLYAVALQGDMEDIQQLHQRMVEEKVPEDTYTYAAVIQGVSRTKYPNLSLKIIKKIMPEKKLVPTAFHFAIVMSGFLQTREYHNVFETSRQMRLMKIKQDFSTKTLLLRAAIGQSLKDVQNEDEEKVLNLEKVSLDSAEALLNYLLEHQDPRDLSSPHPLIGTAQQSLPEAYASNYFEQLIRLYGQKRSLDKVSELFDRYLKLAETSFPGLETSPPVRMLSALLVTHRNDNNFDEVERCWQLAWNKAKQHASRIGIDPDTQPEDWVVPTKRFLLGLPMYHYMKSLVSSGRISELDSFVENYERAGFRLDSKTWNFYVRTLCRNGAIEKAFALTEQHLIHGFPGWPRWSNMRSPGNWLRKQDPGRLSIGRNAPYYRTLVVLAKGYMDLRAMLAFSGDRNERFAELTRVAPRTVEAVTYMPRLDDEEQLRYLRGRNVR